jgi:hypothetical protein
MKNYFLIIILLCVTSLSFGQKTKSNTVGKKIMTSLVKKKSPTPIIVLTPDLIHFKDTTVNKWGFKSSNGKVVIAPKYDFVFPMYDNRAAVRLNNKMGYINKYDSIVIPFIYEDAWPFSEGLARVSTNMKYGMIDILGNIRIPIIYEWMGFFMKENQIKVRLKEDYFMINKEDKISSR